jgi:hypothetical protein
MGRSRGGLTSKIHGESIPTACRPDMRSTLASVTERRCELSVRSKPNHVRHEQLADMSTRRQVDDSMCASLERR